MHFIQRIPRRRLLQGLGAAVAAVPFAGMIPSAEADDAGTKRRIVFFHSGNSSSFSDLWKPDGQGNNFALPAALPEMLQPLEDNHLDNTLLIGLLDMKSYADDNGLGGHKGMGHMLTGRVNNLLPNNSTNQSAYWASGISIDQHLGNILGVEPLTVGIPAKGKSGASRMSYVAANQAVDPIEDPVVAFNQWFGGFDPGTTDAEQIAAAQRQVHAMDNVALELERLKSRLPVADRDKLEIHLGHLLGLQNDLRDFTPVDCSSNAPEGGFDHNKPQDFPIAMRRHLDVVADALACGLTQVASVQNGSTGGAIGVNDPLDWPSEGLTHQRSPHYMDHKYWQDQPELRPMRIKVEQFYVKQFVYLLDRLNSYPEGDCTVLDNTMVIWVKPCGPTHRPINLFNMIAGGKAIPGLNLGRYIERKDQPYNNFLVSLLNLMGVDTDTFGAPQYCTGALSL